MHRHPSGCSSSTPDPPLGPRLNQRITCGCQPSAARSSVAGLFPAELVLVTLRLVLSRESRPSTEAAGQVRPVRPSCGQISPTNGEVHPPRKLPSSGREVVDVPPSQPRTGRLVRLRLRCDRQLLP